MRNNAEKGNETDLINGNENSIIQQTKNAEAKVENAHVKNSDMHGQNLMQICDKQTQVSS